MRVNAITIGFRRRRRIRAFFGPELVVNGNFAAWTADNPNGWTVNGEVGTDPEVSEVGTGEGHGGAGTGMCNIYTSLGVSTSISQTILTSGKRYRLSMIVNTVVTGGIKVLVDATQVSGFLETAQTYVLDFTSPGTELKIFRSSIGVTNDVTFDDVSVKEIT